ncbi:restriction endonuclease subunit S [Enterococcus casseliflavus]|uniref:restriction endonuclease subunit S n=1 Tax=Enterococcus casseliflavus TaxID=37734 RepID=UPI00232E4296|nr:restriction endonuclease subunit S [Enterococcus casseliflavus]MDB1689318.1 restriction endonuclease subunit S [Enterococcus casseliflavus]
MTRKMKDSGVEWIGEIPEGWEVANIGQYFKQRNEKVSDLEYPPLSVTKQGIVPQLDSAAKSSNHNDRKLVKKGDFVINSRSDRKMSAGVAQEDGSVSLINLVLYSNVTEMNTNYVTYLLKNVSFAEEFYRWGTGIVADLWSTKWDRMKKITIPYPTLVEQKKIAEILDYKVKKIDDIIAETQQSIEELKKYKQALITEVVTKGLDDDIEMKDSGIEWIGEIPKGWNIKKLKYCIHQKDSKINFDEGMKYIGLEHIQSASGKILGFSTDFTSTAEKEFQPGDVLYSKLRPYLAKAFVADFSGVCSGEFLVFSNFTGNRYFLLYWLISSKFTDYVNASTYGTKMPRSNWDLIKETTIVLPNKEEQDKIVHYISSKSEQIENLITSKENLVAEYQSYRNSLIYEYVTGKWGR